MGFVRCAIWMAVWGVLCFPIGRWIARMDPNPDRPPFTPWAFERGGAIYERAGIRAWKDIAPDVSKVVPRLVPRKTVEGSRFSPDAIRGVIRETCVAEIVHAMLSVTGLAMLPLWPGWGGAATYAVYVILGNLPFWMIQRYNRPRFARILAAAAARERRRANARTDTVQQ